MEEKDDEKNYKLAMNYVLPLPSVLIIFVSQYLGFCECGRIFGKDDVCYYWWFVVKAAGVYHVGLEKKDPV